MAASKRPKVIDLFAGAGGFSLGAVRAGFDVVGAVELDCYAFATHRENFPKSKHLRRDITRLAGEQLRELAGLGDRRLDALVGGPPCQGFSTMGRRRKNDARNKLFYHFFRLVSELKPLCFVAENVPGILGTKYDVLREESLRLIEPEYEILDPFELSAADFGAATERTRVFFVGWAKDAGIHLAQANFSATPRANTATVQIAFEGLPEEINPKWLKNEDLWQVISKPKSSFGRSINRSLPSVGDENALKRFAEISQVSGFLATNHTDAVVERFRQVEPGRVDIISKFPRLKWDGTCPTLRAGTGSERGSYQAARPIHPTYPRVITTREAARLQGFPDWFVFHPTKWHSFRQIGNSVSPLVSEAVMKILSRSLAASKS